MDRQELKSSESRLYLSNIRNLCIVLSDNDSVGGHSESNSCQGRLLSHHQRGLSHGPTTPGGGASLGGAVISQLNRENSSGPLSHTSTSAGNLNKS